MYISFDKNNKTNLKKLLDPSKISFYLSLGILLIPICIFFSKTSSQWKASAHQFISVTSIKETHFLVEQLDENTLVIFDIDSTLTIPSDPYSQRQAIQRYKSIYDGFVLPLTPNENRLFNHLLVIKSAAQLVEQEFPSFIKGLQKKGVKTIAFTASKTGSIGTVMRSFPDWRYQELKRLDIDFSKTFPGVVLFKNLSDFGGDYPGMEKGIVYCGHKTQKGEVLSTVLKILKILPTTIISIDDKEKNLKSFSMALQKEFPTIKFIGVHYRAVEKLPETQIDEAIFRERMIELTNKAKALAK